MRVVIYSSQKEFIYFPVLLVLPVPLYTQSWVSIPGVSTGNGAAAAEGT